MNTAAVSRGRHLAKLARPQNALYSVLLVAGCALYVHAPIKRVIFCMVIVGCLYACAAAYNNRQDVATDRINKRVDNPLVDGLITEQTLNIFLAGNASAVVAAQLVLKQPTSLILTMIYAALLVAYSQPRLRLQARGWWATLSLCICYGAIPLLLGVGQVGGLVSARVALLAVLQILLLAPLLLAKDYKDTRGDQATGKRTPLVRYGPRVVRGVAGAFTIIGVGSYGALLHFNSPAWIVAAPAVLYGVFCFYLHARHGKVPQIIRKSGNLLILAMSIYSLNALS